MSANPNYNGLGTFLGLLLGAGIKGRQNAKQINNYAENLNQTLPQGYQLNLPHKRWTLQSPTSAIKGYEDMAKRQYDRWGGQVLHDYNPNVPLGPQDVGTAIFNQVEGPLQKQRGLDALEGVKGRRLMQSAPFVRDYTNEQFYGQPPYAPPQAQQPQAAGNGLQLPVTDTLQANASHYVPPDIPENLYVTPDFLDKVMGYQNTVLDNRRADRKQDLSEKTETRQQEQFKFDQQKWKDEEQYRKLRNSKIGKDIENIKDTIAKRKGRAPTRYELLLEMKGKNKITDDEFKKAMLGQGEMYEMMMMMMAGEASGGGVDDAPPGVDGQSTAEPPPSSFAEWKARRGGQ